jgi:hypothetical protein
MASSGNFCTLNPLTQPNAGTFSEGNLLFTHTASAWRSTLGTLGMTTGKWYWEAYQKQYISTGNGWPVGIYDMDSGKFVSNQAGNYPGQSTSTYGATYAVASSSHGEKYHNGSGTSLGFSSSSSGDTWQCAFDADAGKIWFGKNNTWANSGNPSGGSNEAYSSIPSSTWAPITCSYNSSNSENYPYNFGQDDTFSGRVTAQGNTDDNGHGVFKYAPPTGFLALCSANLSVSDDIDPAQTDDDYPAKQFGVVTYTGTGSSNAITGLGFQPDLVWIKKRNGSADHKLIDSNRGVTKSIESSTNDAQATETNGLTAFGSDGFTVGSDSSYNNSSDTYVAWCWRCNGGTTASNTNGDITTTVQANQDAGFSIFTYTGNGGGAGTSMGHGLSKAPDIWFLKNYSSSGESSQKNWRVMLNTGTGSPFRSRNNDEQTAVLNSNGLASGLYRNDDNFEPTATVVQAPNNGNANAFFVASGYTYISYCWHSVEGFSKFGIYKANANDDGPFIYTGFRPKMLFVKNLDENSTEWEVRDTAVNTSNPADKGIYWDQTQAEATRSEKYDILSNGFKIRKADGPGNFGSGSDIIYGAWADVPFKYNNTF